MLPSSTEIFYFYGQTLEQCARLSKGVPMKDLVKVFAKWLKIYAGESCLLSFCSLELIRIFDFAEDVLLSSLKRSVLSSTGSPFGASTR